MADNPLYLPHKTAEDVNALIIEHRNLVYYMLARCNVRNDADCESAAFEALWTAIETFDIYSQGAFSTYACVCIRNAINNVRRQQKLRNLHETVVDFTTDDICPPIHDCTLNIENLETVEKIYRVTQQYIDSLPNGNSRNVISVWYSYKFDISVKKVADLCHTSSANVSRILDTFRAYLSRKLRE